MPPVGSYVKLVILLIHTAAEGSDFQPGKTCEDVDPQKFLSAGNLLKPLQGKHLRVFGLHWPPFAKYNRSVTGNAAWSGVDVDLLEIISQRLHFTYELMEMKIWENETWTQTLFRHLEMGDLVVCYWLNNKERRSRTYMLNGHIDSSMVMAIPPAKIAKPKFSEKLWTFLNPFAMSAWLGILGMCIISGVGYFFLEGLNQGDHYPVESIYEAINVMIFGENPGPECSTARVHSLLWGFVSMVILSIYTANMAAVMTNRAVPIDPIKNMNDLISQGGSCCIYKDAPLWSIISTNFDDVRQWIKKETYLEAGLSIMGLGNGPHCDAFIGSRVELKALRTNTEMCGMRIVGEPLVPNEASWVSSYAASCVGQAVETEIQDLYITGVIHDLIDKYRIPASCPSLIDMHVGEEKEALELVDLAGLFLVYFFGLATMLMYKSCHGHTVSKSQVIKKVSEREILNGERLAIKLRRCCFGHKPNQDNEKEVTLDMVMCRLEEMQAQINDQQQCQVMDRLDQMHSELQAVTTRLNRQTSISSL